MNITKYKNSLENIEFEELNNKHTSAIDKHTNNIFTSITKATSDACPLNNIKFISNYKAPPMINKLINTLRAMYQSYCIYNTPKMGSICSLRNKIIKLIINEKTEDWNKLVKLAYECYGDPKKFWSKTKQLIGKESVHNKPLINKYIIPDSDDSNEGTEITEIITEPINQANHMSVTWQNIYKPNEEPQFTNTNTQSIEKWYKEHKSNFAHKKIINISELDNNHPLLRPVESSEYKYAIKNKNKKHLV